MILTTEQSCNAYFRIKRLDQVWPLVLNLRERKLSLKLETRGRCPGALHKLIKQDQTSLAAQHISHEPQL